MTMDPPVDRATTVAVVSGGGPPVVRGGQPPLTSLAPLTAAHGDTWPTTKVVSGVAGSTIGLLYSSVPGGGGGNQGVGTGSSVCCQFMGRVCQVPEVRSDGSVPTLAIMNGGW
ncbi:hypothetical protein Tco_0587089 [Tanacetum coccineum]